MKKMTFIFCLLSIILLLLAGCNSKVENEDIFQYKNSYVGDNGAVGNITRQLPNPNGEHLSGLELKTTEEPYGIILNYSDVEKGEDIEANYTELAQYNATFILALVHNADWVQFNFVDQTFIVTREDLQNLYGQDIREFNSKKELSDLILNHQ